MANEERKDDVSGHVTPRWVKVSMIIALCLLALMVLVAVVSGGKHGPNRHVGSHDRTESALSARQSG